jgi:hypothetical protein
MTAAVVSTTLEEELRAAIDRHGIVVWLDRDGHYTAFVDALAKRREAGALTFPVLGYRGSFLELMLALEPYGSRLDAEPLLIHMPGYGQTASLYDTPLLELCKAGHPFQKRLQTLITEAAAGRVTPAELDAFLASPSLSLAAADAWLAQERADTAIGFGAQLEARGPASVLDALFEGDREKQALTLPIPPEAAGDLASYLLRHTGMDADWLDFYFRRTAGLRVDQVGEAWAAYLLSVEYVFDLGREPVSPALRKLKDLPKPLKERCIRLVQHFRGRHPDAYAHAADETEIHLHADDEGATAEELGKVDTFRFEEKKIREAAIREAQAGRWGQALTWAKQRAGAAFWLDRELKLRWAWTLVEHAAALGVAIHRTGTGLPEGRSLADAVDHYTREAYVVDAAHRRLEQRFQEKWSTQLDRPHELLEVIDRARREYRDWADELGRSFARLCRAHGALPDASLQQRNIFDRVVLPLVRDREKVAFFMIDAFRYEMAKDLESELQGAGVTVDLQARLAELPTVTEVGMNVLALAAPEGRLAPVIGDGGFGGFRWSEFTVKDPDTRARAIGVGSVGKAAPLVKLADLRTMPLPQLQKLVKNAPDVLVVHSLELDNAGEKGFGPATFEKTLQQIVEAFHHLSQAGVKHFVLSGDHGFLLQDRTVAEHPYHTTNPHRRFVLEERDPQKEGMLTVSLSSLGYDVPAERYLLFREDTGVWKTTRSGAPFVHGGNSLQERVIPVLVVRRRHERGGSDTVYEVEVEALEDNLGRRRLKLKLRLAQFATGALAFTGASQVTLGLRVKERADMSVSIVDVEGEAELVGGLLRVPVKADWATVYFQIEGDAEEPVQVEVFHPDGVEKIAPRAVPGWFAVTSRAGKASAPAPSARPRGPIVAVGIEDEGFRRVFEHLDRYGTVNELELTQILGSARRIRAFSRQFDELVKGVPFRVRIDTTGVMKCYVKETG